MLSTAPPPRYTVQVLLPYSQALNPAVIHRQLLAWRSDVEPIGGQKRKINIRVIAATNRKLEDEMADVLWVLICLANQTGINLTTALQKNFEKKNIRDAQRHRDNEKLKG